MTKIPDKVRAELDLLIAYCWDADIRKPKHTIAWLGQPDPVVIDTIPKEIREEAEECIRMIENRDSPEVDAGTLYCAISLLEYLLSFGDEDADDNS